MVVPAVAVCISQVPSGHLLEGVGYLEGFQDGQVGWFQRVLLLKVMYETRPGKSPFIGTDGQEEGGKTVLPDGINQAKVLPLPVRGRDRLVLKTSVETTE